MPTRAKNMSEAGSRGGGDKRDGGFIDETPKKEFDPDPI